MKKIIILATTASIMLAGPDISMLVDYDAQDNYEAQKQEIQEVKPAPIPTPTLTAPIIPIVIPTDKGCYNNSISLLAGENFTENSSHLDNTPTAGIRVNKCITNNLFVQVGYDRLFNTDYKKSSADGDLKYSRLQKVDIDSLQHNFDDTSINRFYLNGLYEVYNHNRLFPFVLAGIGYENITNEKFNEESGGFFDAGIGVKYNINKKLNLFTQANAIKKFNNGNLDIITALGVGMTFGQASKHHAPKISTYNTASIVNSSSQKSVLKPEPIIEVQEDATIVPISTIQEREIVEPIYEEKSIIVDVEYYIQIAALFKNDLYTDNSQYLQKLEANNLEYEVKQTEIKGKPVQLLLVGPYYSDEEAREDLYRAKSIEKGAFIKKF